jgi:hypothetical protein
VPDSLQPLFAAVRKASLSGPWSQGSKLARDGAVVGEPSGTDSITVRVRTAGQGIAPTVTLYPADLEWSCDCDSQIDPCPHVVAAIVALTQAKEAGKALASGEAKFGRLRYRLASRQAALVVERYVVRGDVEEPFVGSLAAHGGGVGLSPTHEDLAIDRLVTARRGGLIPLERVRELFESLAGALDVRLGSESIRVDREVIGPRASVIDHGDGAALVVEKNPRVSIAVAPGVVRCGDTLHPMGEVDLTGVMLERLPLRRIFAKSDLGQLVTQVLPEMEKKLTVEIKSRRLPRAKSGMKPRIAFDLQQKDHTLSVTASLVYGDPPEAVVRDGRLVQLAKRTPIRDEPTERALVARLREELHLIPGRRVDFDGADAIRFAQRLSVWEEKNGDTHRALFGGGKLVPRVRIDDDMFDLSFDLVPEGEDDPGDGGVSPDAGPAKNSADAGAVLRAWQDGLPLVPLQGGGWAPLPTDWLSRFGSRVSDLLVARRDDGKVERAALPALAELCDALDRPRPQSFERLAPIIEGFDRIPEAPLPADLTATLRPYQHIGISWLTFLRDAGLGAVLADDMGLGKTIQTLCAIKGRTLVVCPRSVVFNWADEIAKFRPSLTLGIYHGPRRALDRNADVVITTYAVLRLDEEILAKEEWACIVIDEAQAIKNPDSQVARAAYALRGDFRVALSGTPVENRLEELWSLLHFTNRGLLGGRRDFDERWSRPIANGVPGAAEAMRKKVRPFVLRRIKRDVAPELPPRTDQILYCELEDSERNVYEAVRAATRKEVVAKLAEGTGVLAALEALLRLRQAACHPSLVPGQHAATSSKVERLIASLEEAAADGHKALVFSQWTSLLDLVEPHMREAGIDFVRLDGSTRDRAAVVNEFQSASGPPAMLISLKAGGTGLNLTAADHVYLLDPWWNPAVEDQAADRAHRIGQDKPVFVHKLVAKDTVEEGILVLQSRKRSLADAALGEADRAAALTREDLMALLA